MQSMKLLLEARQVKEKGVTTSVIIMVIVAVIAVAGVGGYLLTTFRGEAVQGLQIVLKDQGMPEVKYLQPTITEIQLQRQNGEWITIWSDPEGETVRLTADGAEVVLDTVSLEAGTYVGTRLLVSTIEVEVDVNRDNDTLDENVEIVLPENVPPPPGMEESEYIKAMADQIKPRTDQITNLTGTMDNLVAQLEAMGVSPPVEGQPPENLSPEAQALIDQINGIRTQIDGLVEEVEGLMNEIKELTGGTGPPRRENGYIYTRNYLDEKHTAIPLNNIVPVVWEENFVYGGSGGTILYDLTLHPLKLKQEQISVEVSTIT